MYGRNPRNLFVNAMPETDVSFFYARWAVSSLRYELGHRSEGFVLSCRRRNVKRIRNTRVIYRFRSTGGGVSSQQV